MKREAGIRINGETQEFGGRNRRVKRQAGLKKRWRGPRERTQVGRKNQRRWRWVVKRRNGHGDGENESRWRKSGRKEGRGSETKMTPSEVQQMLHWCEEEAALMTAKCSEEIQAEKEAKRRCEEVVAGELEEIATRTPLGRVCADFDWEKEERRKREIGEEEEERRDGKERNR